MCKTMQDVRYFDLYVIGSEGCHLCLPCEIQVVEFARQAAGQALQKKKQEFITKRQLEKQMFFGLRYGGGITTLKDALESIGIANYTTAAPCSKCFSREGSGGLPPLGLCSECSKPPKNTLTGGVSG